MNRHLITVLVAAAASLAVSAPMIYLAKHRAPERIVVQASPETTARAIARQAARQWGELPQKAVDDLTARLGKIDKQPVLILCRDRSDCGDLALDLENAFESAHWDVKIDAPVIDDTIGLSSNDATLAAAVTAATKLTVAVVPKSPNHPAFVVIGRKTGG